MRPNYPILALTVLLTSIQLGHAGELEPADMKYPNVVLPVYQFGSYGDEPGRFNNMGGVAALDGNRLLIADTYNFRVQEVTLDGTPLRSWTILGPRGESVAPIDVETLPSGGFAVLDARTDTILLISADGSVQRQIGSSSGIDLQSPSAFRISHGRLYVADTGNARIVVVPLDEREDPAFVIGGFGQEPGRFKRPADVAVDSEGQIYVADADNDRIQKFSADGRFLAEWGEWGSYSGMLATPISLHIHNKRLFVADLVNHRIQVFDTDGVFSFQFGRHPPQSHEGNGRVHYPSAVTVTPDGRYTVVCEPFEHRCQVFDEFALATVNPVDDSAWWDKATRFHYGTGATVSQSMLMITEPDTHAALLFDIRGEAPRFLTAIGGRGSLPGEFIRPSGSYIDEDAGRLFVSDSGNRRIQTFNLNSAAALSDRGGWDGLEFAATLDLVNPDLQREMSVLSEPGSPELLRPENELSEPSGVSIGPDGNLWVIDPQNARMMVLNSETFELVRVWGEEGTGETQMNNPLKFSFSEDGETVFVADHYNYRVQAYTLNGEHLYSFGGPESDSGKLFVLPFGIAGGVDGHVYVTDVGSHQVLKFTESGEFVGSWGSWGDEPGQFYKPKGIAQAPDGRIYVVDFGNHRAQYFDPDGTFLGSFGINEEVRGGGADVREPQQ